MFLVLSQFHVADKILPLTSVTPKYCGILGSDTNNMNRNQRKHEAIHNRLCLKNMNWENAFKLHRSWQPCRTWSRFFSSTEYFCVLVMRHSLTCALIELITSLFPLFLTTTQEKGFTYFFTLQSLHLIKIFYSGHWRWLFRVPWLLMIFQCTVSSGLDWVPVLMPLPLILIGHIPCNLSLHSNHTLTLITFTLTTTTPSTL